jgi:hypothetical protein
LSFCKSNLLIIFKVLLFVIFAFGNCRFQLFSFFLSMKIFATLYFRDIENEDSHYQLLKQLGYSPEIYFESGWKRLSHNKQKERSAKIKSEFNGCSVHLPYRDIFPGSGDPTAEDMLAKAADISTLYSPIHLVGHACFRPLTDAKNSPAKHLKMTRTELKGLNSTPNEAFIGNSVSAWKRVIEATDSNLFLENTNERSPYPLQLLLEELPKARSSMCLDIGHWHYAGMGSCFQNLEEWISLCSNRLGHLHLHDNDGSGDQHYSIGKGRIDFALLWSLLRQYSLNPSATVENQTPQELLESSNYLGQHPF